MNFISRKNLLTSCLLGIGNTLSFLYGFNAPGQAVTFSSDPTVNPFDGDTILEDESTIE